MRHGSVVIDLPDRSFEGIRTYLSKHNIEGIVFWKDGEPRCKIKRKDFGFKWPDDKKRVKLYVFEAEMLEEYKKLLNEIAEKENISLDKLTSSALEYMTDHVEETMEWKAELEKLPEDKKMAVQQIRVLRTYPVYTGETDMEARERALLKEIQTSLKLPEMSQKEFLDHIDEEEFFLTFGNPVIINFENGQKLVCMAWQMAERLMRMTGRGEEADEVILKAAEIQENE